MFNFFCFLIMFFKRVDKNIFLNTFFMCEFYHALMLCFFILEFVLYIYYNMLMFTKCDPILFEKFVKRLKLISEKEAAELIKKTFKFNDKEKNFEYILQPEFTLKRK